MRHRTPYPANPVRLPHPKPGNGAAPRIGSAVVTALCQRSASCGSNSCQITETPASRSRFFRSAALGGLQQLFRALTRLTVRKVESQAKAARHVDGENALAWLNGAPRAAFPDPSVAAASAIASRVVAAPSFRFPQAPEAEVQADALVALYRRAIEAHGDPSGYDARDLARREEAIRQRLNLAWGDLQRAAQRFLKEAKR